MWALLRLPRFRGANRRESSPRFPGAPGVTDHDAFGSSDQVFMRTSRDRLPIRKLWGPSLPKELVKDEVANAFKRVVSEDGGQRILHEIERLMPKRAAS